MTILWFRRDLRITDNPLLSIEGDVLPIFIFDTNILEKLQHNDRRVRFIFDHVMNLKNELKKIGLELALFHDTPKKVFETLLHVKPDRVCASGDYDPYALERDREISHLLPFERLKDTYIFEPEDLLKKDGTPYLVFTPFYKHAKSVFTPDHLKASVPVKQKLFKYHYASEITLQSLGFEAQHLDITPPKELLEALKHKLPSYVPMRDVIAEDATSHLSMHLRFGTLGIRELLRFLLTCKRDGIDTEPFFRQLIFREFYAHLLYHFPHLTCKNFRYRFSGVEDDEKMRAFCEARTGVPIVDAGVRELLQSGDMHNRVRMICASFFTKDLLLPWQWGEAFFAAHLNDYDAASNILSWQWSAGTGVDPQPYFRIFNPYLQSKKFDSKAVYIKKWLPQLQSVAPKLLHDEAYLLTHTLENYPQPLLDHKAASATAKEYFKSCLHLKSLAV